MPIPCESTPRRSVRTMSPAVTSAIGRDIFMATSAVTMNSWSRVWLTRIADSAMDRSPVVGGLEPGDLDAAVLDLVAAIDGGQHRGDALDRPGVGQRAGVDRAEPDRPAELGHGVLGVGVPAADEQIAVDRLVELGQLVSGDVVDRKSTRLNSSHLVISYAVFCLKKKKKKKPTH